MCHFPVRRPGGDSAAIGPSGYAPHHDWQLLAWMPDSTDVIVTRHSFQNPRRTYKELGLLNTATAAYRQIAITTAEGELHPGFAVAVSPDAQHLAYQASQSLVVVALLFRRSATR